MKRQPPVVGRWSVAAGLSRLPSLRPLRCKLFLRLAAVALLALALMGAGETAARFDALGNRMMCACGCRQILLQCNHVGCTYSDRMRKELAASLQRGDNDDLIQQAFVQKYGSTVLAAPTTTGFNRIAWIMPFAVFGLATMFAVVVIRRWRTVGLAAPAQAGSAALDRFREQARRETEL